MHQAITELVAEHDAILAALRLLERLAAHAQRHGHAAGETDELLGFFREFLDRCHHGKEETLLFPAMLAAGLASHGGFVAELHAEHVEGRARLAALAQAATPAAFAAAVADYAALLRAHIDKENAVFFPMAERLLGAATLAELQRGFAAHERQVLGAGRHAELHALLQRLQARYPA